MTQQAQWSVRRASVEDVPALKEHWQKAGVLDDALEKNLTEFQIAENSEGTIRGVVGVRLHDQQAWIYHESFIDQSEAGSIQEAIWKRIHTLAQNHALYKIWTHSDSPTWTRLKFLNATQEVLSEKPSEFQMMSDQWKVLVLREPSEEAVSLDNEFELFQKAQQADREQLMKQTAMMKIIAYTILIITLVGGGTLLVVMFSKGLFFMGK